MIDVARDGTASIGVDIGGTTTRAAFVGSGDDVIGARRIATDALHDVDELAEWIIGSLHDLNGKTTPSTATRPPMGVSVPGLLDRQRQRVRRCLNVPWLEGADLTEKLTRAGGAPVVLTTDAEAATWGEYVACGRRPQDFAHLRMGTGVALGVVMRGHLLDLDQDRTEHLDVLVVDRCDRAPFCSCGLRGCAEALISGPVLERTLIQRGIASDLTKWESAVGRGDRQARLLFEETMGWLIGAMENVVTRWRLRRLVLGGGVLTAAPSLFEGVRKRWYERKTDGDDPVVVEHARLGDHAGLIGAALLARSRSDNGAAQGNRPDG